MSKSTFTRAIDNSLSDHSSSSRRGDEANKSRRDSEESASSRRRLRAVGVVLLAGLLRFLPVSVHAQPSSANSISFQGALTGANGQALANGNYNLAFNFYINATTTTASATTNVAGVPVTNGIASTAIPVQTAWFDGQTRYLGISVNGAPELTPRVLITAVPCAVAAAKLIDTSATDLTDGAPELHGIELRWFQTTPYIDFTHSPNPNRDFDYRISCESPSDPRLVIRSDAYENALVIRRNAFVGIGTAIPGANLDVNGTARMTVCQITSDRNAKTNFAPTVTREILAKLATLPISTWAYTNATGIRHIGPVAQDFQAAFAVGEDDKHIATVDADGVALASIQGLYQLVQEKDVKIHDLETRLQSLERKLKSGCAANERP